MPEIDLNNMDTLIRQDPGGMLALTEKFPLQCAEAIRLGHEFKLPENYGPINKIVVTGLGGSAIGGDFLRAYLSPAQLKLPFIVNRHYALPSYVDAQSLVLAVSYSGNTEETLGAFKDALKKKAKIIVITSGGELKNLARRFHKPCMVVPGGQPPRASTGYLFFTALCVLEQLKLIPRQTKALEETLQLLNQMKRQYGGDVPIRKNAAKKLALSLQGKVPVIYSASDYYDVVGLRWKTQINENSKGLALVNVIPEMNHNEILGWEALPALMKNFAVVFLRDKADHTRVQIRMSITQQLIRHDAGMMTEVWAKGRSPLARMFSLIVLGDFTSVYMAFLNKVDPTSIDRINYLKKSLAKAGAFVK